jgi:hypothetical protein
VAALLAIPVAFIAGADKDMQMFKVFLVLGTLIGFILWMVPMAIVAAGGGVGYFLNAFEEKKLNFLDFIDFFLSELMILLFVVYAWMYHEISLDVQKYKNSTKASWAARIDDYGIMVWFPDKQMERMVKVLTEDCGGYVPKKYNSLTATSRQKAQSSESGENYLSLEEVVRILEVLPGWDCKIDIDVDDHHKHHLGRETGLFSALTGLSEEANQKNMWPLDIWLVRTQYFSLEGHEMRIKDGIQITFSNAWAMIKMIWSYLQANMLALVVLTSLAVIRTMLPRWWLWYVLGGSFWPKEPFGPTGQVVTFSTLVSFSISFFWIGLFYFVLMEYRRNLCQVVAVSSLVDARERMVWSQCYLMSMFWFGMDSDQSEAVLAKMPLLDLKVSSNVAAFWRLREYVTLDRSNERMGVSILLEIVIIWLLLKFAATCLTIYFSQTGLPAVLIVTMFDLLVFGGMVLMALSMALKLNDMMEKHKKVFVEAKYAVSLEHGIALKQGKSADELQDLDLARRLLEEYLDMAKEYDVRDCILFGMEVTPGKVLSSTLTVLAAVATLVGQMIRTGQFKAELPEDVQEGLVEQAERANRTAFVALRHTVRTLFLCLPLACPSW